MATATAELYTLSLHDALPISPSPQRRCRSPPPASRRPGAARRSPGRTVRAPCSWAARSEEHTSELQSQFHLVCRLLLEKKNFAPRLLFNIRAELTSCTRQILL